MVTTGRKVVAPGQTIQSVGWGNLLWDQSIQCFASAADRDAQYPAPHDGSKCYLDDVDRFYARVAGAWVRDFVVTDLDLGNQGGALNADATLTPGTAYGTVAGLGSGLLTTWVAGNAVYVQTFTIANALAPTVYSRTRSGGTWWAWAKVGPYPIIVTGSPTPTSNGGGAVTVPYGFTFAAAPNVVAVSTDITTPTVCVTGTTVSAFTATVLLPGGGAATTRVCRMTFQAIL